VQPNVMESNLGRSDRILVHRHVEDGQVYLVFRSSDGIAVVRHTLE
jgi:hypothetical protein